MNGAITLPCVSTMSAPKTASMMRTGINQYFFRARTNCHSSTRKEIMARGSHAPAQLARQPEPDLLGASRRVVLVVVEVAGLEHDLAGEVEAGHEPLSAEIQGGRVDSPQSPPLVHAVGTTWLHDPDQPTVVEPVVCPDLGDEHGHRSEPLDAIRDLCEADLIGRQGSRLLFCRDLGLGGLIRPRGVGEVYRVMVQLGPMCPPPSFRDGPQAHEGTSLLDLTLEFRDVKAITPRVLPVHVVDADVDENQTWPEIRDVRDPEIEIRDHSQGALPVEAGVGDDDVAPGSAQGPFQHGLPRCFIGQVELVRRAPTQREDADPCGIDPGAPQAIGISPIDELATARIQGRRRYGPLHVVGNGEPAQRVRRDPLAEGQLPGHGEAKEHGQVDGDHAEELHHQLVSTRRPMAKASVQKAVEACMRSTPRSTAVTNVLPAMSGCTATPSGAASPGCRNSPRRASVA